MAADDLEAPLGQDPEKKPRFRLPFGPLTAAAGALGAVLFVFMLWVAFAHNPMGGEPMAVAPMAQGPVVAQSPPPAAAPQAGDPSPSAETAKPPGQTIRIIDGSSGKSQEVVIPEPSGQRSGDVDARFLEKSRHGSIPRIAADGARPSEAFAQPVKAAPGTSPNGPRIAIVIGGLGIGAAATADALSKLPGPVTLAFSPYVADLPNLAGRARGKGHEVVLQIPMEPFDYPDNDPGPQTLLTSISADQNIDRLHWLLSRAQGYVGVTSYMGARFTASEQSLTPVLRDIAKRGLLYVDDGASPRSLAGQMAGSNNLPFVKADVVLDSVPIPAEIDRALARLEALARERGTAVGMATGSPAIVDRVAQWAKAAAGRGLLLVPISAVAVKPKSS